MKKIIAIMNMTFDGYCDPNSMIANVEMHQYYNDLISDADMILYGRKTYQMMESFWTAIVKEPTGKKGTDNFAISIDKIKKVVFSETLRRINGNNAVLKSEVSKERILEFKQQANKNILVSSPSLIIALMKLNLIDEYQISVQPNVVGKGLPLFKNVNQKINFTLNKVKQYNSGVVTFYYQPEKTDA